MLLGFMILVLPFHGLQESGPEPSLIPMGDSFRLSCESLPGGREVNVWTPPSYSNGEREYPVLYVIDGGMDQDFHHVSGLAQLATINGSFEELIVVGIRTEDRISELAHSPTDKRYQKQSPTAGKSGEFLRYIEDVVIPFIEKRYRTSSRRGVIGESLAGLFITEVFLRSPKTFTDYIAISPSLWWDDKALAKDAPRLLATHDESPRRLYLTMANEGGTMQQGLDMVMDAIRANKPAGLDWLYVDRSETEVHSTIYHGAAHDALLKHFGFPRRDVGELPWYLIEGASPPESDEDEGEAGELPLESVL